MRLVKSRTVLNFIVRDESLSLGAILNLMIPKIVPTCNDDHQMEVQNAFSHDSRECTRKTHLYATQFDQQQKAVQGS